jgi:uncharacterized membrane protein YvbJ
LVYCSKCGTRNEDNTKICSKCGAPLYTVGERYSGSEREHDKRVERGCFGLPHGGKIVSLLFGIILVIVGISRLLNIQISIWALILIVIGILLLTSAIYRMRRF